MDGMCVRHSTSPPKVRESAPLLLCVAVGLSQTAMEYMLWMPPLCHHLRSRAQAKMASNHHLLGHFYITDLSTKLK